MRKSLVKVAVFILFFSCEAFGENSSDTEIKNHPLLGKTVYNSDYTIVVKGSDKFEGQISSAVNARLMTLDNRFYTKNYPDENFYVDDVFKPKTEFKVLAVYHNKPSLIRGAFSEGYDFAVLQRENKKYISPIIFQNEIAWEINGCKKDQYCNYWRNAFVTCVADKTCEISFGLRMLDEKNQEIFPSEQRARRISPPYPQTWVENNMKSFGDYAKKHPEIKLDLNYIHLRVTGKDLTPKQLGDIFFHFEKLNIGDNVSVGGKNPTLSVPE